MPAKRCRPTPGTHRRPRPSARFLSAPRARPRARGVRRMASGRAVTSPAVRELEGAPYVRWAPFLRWFRRTWRQGQHVSVIGPTGCGKSFLTRPLLRIRTMAGGSVVILGTKPADDTLDHYIAEDGFTRVTQWPPKPAWFRWQQPADWDRRVILWPPYRGTADRAVQADVF